MKRLLTVIGIVTILTILWSFFIKTNPDVTEVSKLSGTTEIEAVQEVQDVDVAKSGVARGIETFLRYTGFTNVTPGHLVMILVGLIFIYLAIKYDYEPLLLVPIGTGILIGNIEYQISDQGWGRLECGLYYVDWGISCDSSCVKPPV